MAMAICDHELQTNVKDMNLVHLHSFQSLYNTNQMMAFY